jgi:hypothetical protein
MPVLGRGVGFAFDPAGQVSALAAAGDDQAGLPRILRAAVGLDAMAEAVCLLNGLAIVLPSGAPAALTAPSAGAARSVCLGSPPCTGWMNQSPG